MADERIVPINIEDEMKTAYIDYSMSVIVSRALPDVRDGLKPVHRRVLYGMTDLGLASNRPHKKSARIVGEVLGKYHPHGDQSVYDAMVRMAQAWNLRYMLVDGQGNYGSIDGDPPAAMRYTEARLRKMAEDMIVDIDKNTVDFRPNFDDSLTEPTVLPAKIPNLLINGSSGIAVGMATNMAPHNLSEVIDGIVAYIDNNDITIDELMQFVKAPDFPTGGSIYGYEGVKDAFHTGRGRVMMRAKSSFEVTATGKNQIIVTEIPYQVNKAELIKKTVNLIEEKVIDGISDIRDESDRDGYRVVFDLKRDAVPNIVLNKLYKYTQLQTSFSVNNIALVKGRPVALNLKDQMVHFVSHRHEIIVRRTQYELEEARKRAHILEGLLIAIDHLDEVIKIIRGSQTPDLARVELMSNFGLSEIQSKAILDMRLRTLTGLERDKIKDEYTQIMELISRLEAILSDEAARMQIIKDELADMKQKYGDERRTEIIYAAGEFRMEDMIPDDEMVITISRMGYIKRTPTADYRAQNRGGRGQRGVSHRDEDFVEHLFIATNHNYLLFFTDHGRCYWLKVYEIPEGAKTTKGRAIQNMVNMPADDKIRTVINVMNLEDKEYLENNNIVLCTKKGIIKKTNLELYSRPRTNGINAINIREDDELLDARLTDGTSEIILASNNGKAIRFNESLVRPMGRNATGVKGMRLAEGDEVIGMIAMKVDTGKNVMVVTEKGYGKRSEIDEYRVTGRGGKGVKAMNVTEKTGKLVAILDVDDTQDLMIINRGGLTIRLSVDTLRVVGRVTQGVKLVKINDKDSIASVALVNKEEEEELIEGEEIDGTEIDNTDPIALAQLDGEPLDLTEEEGEDESDDTPEKEDPSNQIDE